MTIEWVDNEPTWQDKFEREAKTNIRMIFQERGKDVGARKLRKNKFGVGSCITTLFDERYW